MLVYLKQKINKHKKIQRTSSFIYSYVCKLYNDDKVNSYWILLLVCEIRFPICYLNCIDYKLWIYYELKEGKILLLNMWIWVHKTSLKPPLLIEVEVPVPSPKSVRSFICVLGVSVLPHSSISLLEYGTIRQCFVLGLLMH